MIAVRVHRGRLRERRAIPHSTWACSAARSSSAAARTSTAGGSPGSRAGSPPVRLLQISRPTRRSGDDGSRTASSRLVQSPAGAVLEPAVLLVGQGGTERDLDQQPVEIALDPYGERACPRTATGSP